MQRVSCPFDKQIVSWPSLGTIEGPEQPNIYLTQRDMKFNEIRVKTSLKSEGRKLDLGIVGPESKEDGIPQASAQPYPASDQP